MESTAQDAMGTVHAQIQVLIQFPSSSHLISPSHVTNEPRLLLQRHLLYNLQNKGCTQTYRTTPKTAVAVTNIKTGIKIPVHPGTSGVRTKESRTTAGVRREFSIHTKQVVDVLLLNTADKLKVPRASKACDECGQGEVKRLD
ncbi:hypothetical protein AOLI_G00325680 [Acnodon oligacanthus]